MIACLLSHDWQVGLGAFHTVSVEANRSTPAMLQGPELMTCGPYRPVKLLAYTARILSVHTHALVSPAPELAATLRVDAKIVGDLWLARYLRITVLDGTRVLDTFYEEYDNALGQYSVTLQGIVDADLSQRVQLWWPVGYGEQPLYDIAVELLTDVSSLQGAVAAGNRATKPLPEL